MKYRVTYVRRIRPSPGPRSPQTAIIECDERPIVGGPWGSVPGLGRPVIIKSCHAVNLDPPNPAPLTTNTTDRDSVFSADRHEKCREKARAKHLENLARMQNKSTYPDESSVE